MRNSEAHLLVDGFDRNITQVENRKFTLKSISDPTEPLLTQQFLKAQLKWVLLPVTLTFAHGEWKGEENSWSSLV